LGINRTRASELSQDDDLSNVLKRLMSPESGTRKTRDARKRLANDPITRDLLEAGLRLVTRQLQDSKVFSDASKVEAENYEETIAFFEWITYKNVVAEAEREGIHDANLGKIRDRWPFKDRYVEDLLAYSLWVKHLAPNIQAAADSANELGSSEDLVEAIHKSAYREVQTTLGNSYFPVSLMTTAIGDRYPYLREAMGKSYDLLHQHWVPIYQALFEAYGLSLRKGVSYEDLADILSALSEGLAVRVRADPGAHFVDAERKSSMLGKAALMLIAGCVDCGNQLDLEEAVRKLAGLHTSIECEIKDTDVR
jgi:hypothetical protein